ncbi:MAG: MATE family efflux transporter [Pseudomonadota bacterium]
MTLPTRRDIFSLAWPLALNAIMLHGLVVIDAVLVTPLGEAALAAMGLAASIGGFLVGVIFAFCNATQILIARAYGAKDEVALKSALWCGLAINLVATVLGLTLVAILGRHIVESFAQTTAIAQNALEYLTVFAVVILAEAFAQCLTCYFNGCGRTRIPFFSHLIAMPTNVGLSAMLIYGIGGAPELGLIGAAIGSAVGAVLRGVYLAWQIMRYNRVHIGLDGWSHGTFLITMRRNLMFSLPIAATFTSVVLANSLCALLYARMGVNQFAAMTIILPWVQLTGQLMITWAQASAILIGQLLGNGAPSGKIDRFLTRSWRSALGLGIVVIVTYVALGLSFPLLYRDLQDETLDALTSFLPALVLLTLPKCSNAVCGNTLRAGGDTVYVMNIFLVSQWLIRVPLTALCILMFHLSATWVFALFLLDELVKFPPFHLRLRAGKWKVPLDQRV